MSAAAVEKLLYHECGLKGLSGVSNDVRELEASSDPKAGFALDYFAYRVGLNAGMLAAALGGVGGAIGRQKQGDILWLRRKHARGHAAVLVGVGHGSPRMPPPRAIG